MDPEETEIERARRLIHPDAVTDWDWELLAMALRAHWDEQDRRGGEARGHIPAEEREEIAEAIAKYVYRGRPKSYDDPALVVKVADAELLHETAKALADSDLHLLADKVASPALLAIERFERSYAEVCSGMWVRAGRNGEPGDATRAELRDHAKAVLALVPATDLEFQWMVRAVCLVGLHARLKHQYGLPCAMSRKDYLDASIALDDLPFCVLGAAAVKILTSTVAVYEMGLNRDENLVVGLLLDAGPSWWLALTAGLGHVTGGALGSGPSPE